MSTSSIDYVLNDWWDEAGHPYLADHFRGGPWRIVATVIIYVLFVTKVGPNWMRDRKPFQLERLIKFYNLANIVVNSFILAVGLYVTNWSADLWQCERYDLGATTRLILGQGYMYLKIFDLLDTVFFVLRKKQNQVTTLHVWHHASMPVMVWIACKFYPLTPIAMVVLLNTFIHILMYTYYYMAADPVLRQHLWWKRYITLAQLVQFSLMFAHGVTIFFQGCDLPPSLALMGFAQDAYMMYAFSSFYFKSYKTSEKSPKNIPSIVLNNNNNCLSLKDD